MKMKKMLAVFMVVIMILSVSVFPVKAEGTAETSNIRDNMMLKPNDATLLAIKDCESYVIGSFIINTNNTLGESQIQLNEEQLNALQEAQEDACPHTGQHSVQMISSKRYGPNSAYCYWYVYEYVKKCVSCGEKLGTEIFTEYTHHTFLFFPPNIQVCSRCGHSL